MKKFTYEILYDLYWHICYNHYNIQQTGWIKINDFKGIKHNDCAVYKDNIMIVIDRNYGNIAMSIYVANSPTDYNPLLIYKINKNHYSIMVLNEEGWGNINDWSLFAYQIITETIEKVEFEKQKEIATKFKKHYERTENMKSEALEEIRKKLKIPFKLKYELLEGMSKDSKLNDFILEQEEEDARTIVQKLSE